MAKIDPVVHFEMPAKDRTRVADFYTTAFGWKMNQLGEDMGNYLIAQTTETDENRMPKEVGAINGGFWETQDDNVLPHIVISVDSIEESIKKIEEAGGKVLGAPSGQRIDDIPGIGLYTSFKDTEDNLVGILQPHKMG